MVASASLSAQLRSSAALVLLLGSSLAALSSRTATARTWHVPGDAATIQAGIDSSGAGDDVLVAPGEYQEHDISMKGGVWVHSEQGPARTTVDAQGAGVGFECVDLQEGASIEGFQVVHGRAHGTGELQAGGGVRCLDSRLKIRDCVFFECSAEGSSTWGGGIYAYNSDLEITSCNVTRCDGGYLGGGIAAYECTTRIVDCTVMGNVADHVGGILATGAEVIIERCVIASNWAYWGYGGGLAVASGALMIRDCLVAGNWCGDLGDGDGLAVSGVGSVLGTTVAHNTSWSVGANAVSIDSGSDIVFQRTIIAFNDGPAIDCGGGVSVNCSDMFGNSGGNANCGTDLGGNFSADPLFCDAGDGDYTLDWASPCLPGNHPDGVDCGLIGALGAGCGTPPTGACCFANGSCLDLGQEACAEQGGSYMGNGTTCDPNPCEPTRIESTTWGRIKAGFR